MLQCLLPYNCPLWSLFLWLVSQIYFLYSNLSLRAFFLTHQSYLEPIFHIFIYMRVYDAIKLHIKQKTDTGATPCWRWPSRQKISTNPKVSVLCKIGVATMWHLEPRHKSKAKESLGQQKLWSLTSAKADIVPTLIAASRLVGWRTRGCLVPPRVSTMIDAGCNRWGRSFTNNGLKECRTGTGRWRQSAVGAIRDYAVAHNGHQTVSDQ